VKAAAAAAGPGSATGLVLADGLMRQILSTGAAPDWWCSNWQLRIVVAEGEFDWLTWATRWADSAEEAPAVLGVWAGSWQPEIAARIPDGARISVRTDPDAAGHGYADKIAGSLAPRCAVLRHPQEASHVP